MGQLLGLKIVYISGKRVMVICCLGGGGGENPKGKFLHFHFLFCVLGGGWGGNTPSASFTVSFFVFEISNHCVK